MEANIIDGVYVRVAGDAGKTGGLSWRIVENMFDHLQELIVLLAKYELETKASPNLKEFDIEIFDFKSGSAVPAFRLVPNPQQEIIPIIQEQKSVVAEKFNTLMSYANTGKYEDFFRKDGLPEVRYEIAEELYGFTIAAGSSPITIVEPINGNGTFKEIYKVPRFNRHQSEYLLKPRARRRTAEEPEEILGLIQRIGKRRKIIDLYENKETVLSIALQEIIVTGKIYHLYNPIVCEVQKEDGNFIIENEMLDLFAAGIDIEKAKYDFYNEFNESFQLLNSILDDNLSPRLLRAKNALNAFIKEITRN